MPRKRQEKTIEKTEEKVVGTTVFFPEQLWKELKKEAIDEGVSLKKHLIRVIEEHFNRK